MPTTAARKYPRDLAVGTRVMVRMATPRGPKSKPGTIAELTQDGGRYRIVVDLDGGDRVRLFPAANAKLDLAPRVTR
jgi:hypothetical protein